MTKRTRRARRPMVDPLEGRALMTAGALDTTFGGTGMVTTDVSPLEDRSFSVAVQPDLKVVAYGSGFSSPSGPSAPNQVEVVRYNADGSLDASFGSAGKVILGNLSTTSYGKGLALQSDGKIVLVGTYYDAAKAHNDFEVVRLNANGSLDTTFGGGTGKVITAVTPYEDDATGLMLQADGKIVVEGQAVTSATTTTTKNRGVVTTTTTSTYGVAILRYNADGSLDTSFGTGGKAIVSPAHLLPGTPPQVDSMAIDSGGRILIVGDIPYLLSGSSQYYEGNILRFTAAGRLDTTFGSGGQVTMLPPGAMSSEIRDVGLQSTGKIVVVGSGSQSPSGLARYNTDGSLDTTFGTNGFSPLSSRVNVWNPFVIQPDDKIVAGCQPLVNGVADVNTWLMRVLADGTSADPTFGQGGLAEAAFGVNTLTRGMAVGPDGRIVVASSETSLTYSSPMNQFRIARFLGDPHATTTALASSANPATSGQPVALTATVIAAYGVPTGTVEFYDGTTLLGTATLATVNGVTAATFTTTVLAAGTHNLRAIYDGDANDQGSASGYLSQVVS